MCVRAARCLLIACLALPALAAAQPAPDDRGTLGIVVRQIFSETQPNHRGPLAVMHVDDDYPAAKAGIRCSDFIVAVNGVPVPGREYSAIFDNDIHGPIGGQVHLTISRYDGSQSEIALVRAPYPPHTNPASDPFAYSVPGSWSMDPRYAFPLPWSPALAYHGFEDLFYTPDFDRTDSPEYHSYLFFLWLEGAPAITASQLQSDMLVYFRGLALERGQTYNFTPDLSKVTSSYSEDPSPSSSYGGAPTRTFPEKCPSGIRMARSSRCILKSWPRPVPAPGTPPFSLACPASRARALSGNNWTRCATPSVAAGNSLPPFLSRLVPVNTHPSPRRKFTTEHARIATPFAATTGIPTIPTSNRINIRFPAIETAPFDK
jgi:PDZ domain